MSNFLGVGAIRADASFASHAQRSYSSWRYGHFWCVAWRVGNAEVSSRRFFCATSIRAARVLGCECKLAKQVPQRRPCAGREILRQHYFFGVDNRWIPRYADWKPLDWRCVAVLPAMERQREKGVSLCHGGWWLIPGMDCRISLNVQCNIWKAIESPMILNCAFWRLRSESITFLVSHSGCTPMWRS